MKRLTRQFMYGLGHKDCCDACSVCDVAGCCDSLEEILEKLAHYEDLEEQLEKLYGGKMPLDEVVENLNRIVQNGEEKLDYARILTNAEAEKWDKYKDLEEQGRLIELPCAVGDTVYTNQSMSGWYMQKKKRPYEAKIVFIGINGIDNFFNIEFKQGMMLQFKFSDIGKTVFLTKEEAEAKLKELGDEHEWAD